MLPSMTELMPPFAFYDFGLVDLVDGPEVAVGFVEEDGLEDVLVIGDRSFIGVVVHAKLMLIICAVKGHFDLLHVLWVGVGVIHGSVTWWFTILTFLFILSECDLSFLFFILGFGAEFRVETGFVVFLEVFAVGVGDGDVVEEVGAAEDEFLTPSGGFAEDFEGIVGENAHD